jgi:hypothetical protein
VEVVANAFLALMFDGIMARVVGRIKERMETITGSDNSNPSGSSNLTPKSAPADKADPRPQLHNGWAPRPVG